jgi:hypothetical protein
MARLAVRRSQSAIAGEEGLTARTRMVLIANWSRSVKPMMADSKTVRDEEYSDAMNVHVWYK